MDRSEAQAIIHQELPPFIVAVLAFLPVEVGADTTQKMFDEMFDPMVEGLMSGTVVLDAEGHIPIRVLGGRGSVPPAHSN